MGLIANYQLVNDQELEKKMNRNRDQRKWHRDRRRLAEKKRDI